MKELCTVIVTALVILCMVFCTVAFKNCLARNECKNLKEQGVQAVLSDNGVSQKCQVIERVVK